MTLDVKELRNISAQAFTDFEAQQAKAIEKQMNNILALCKIIAERGEYSCIYKLEASYLLTQAIMTRLSALGLKCKLNVLELTISWE